MMCIRKVTGALLASIFSVSAVMSSGLSKPEEEFNNYYDKYPDEAAIYTLRKQEVNYTLVNDSIVTTILVYEELLHLGDNTGRYAGEKVYTSSFIEVSNLKAYTLVPEKRKYKKIDVVEFKKSFDTNSGVFYDDTKEISFTYPSVQKGVKTILEYTKTIKDPRMIGMYFFDTYLPVDKAVYTVIYDDRLDVSPKFNNVESLKINEEKSKVSDNQSSLTYTARHIDKIKFERSCPSYNYMAASVYCPITQFNDSDGETRHLISTPEVLHSWYRTFIQDIQNHDPEIKSLVSAIVDSDDSDLEKVKKIYAWVQGNIKYIAFEDGMRGLIPHPGNYVIEKRYGDCKDMASAIVSMLREAGVEAHFTWVGTRDIPYQYSDVPSPITDNHMIASVLLEGKTYFLDATGQYLPLGLPSSMIQGKECLISLNEVEFLVEKVPVIPKEENVMSDSIAITIDNGTVYGKGTVDLKGYAKFFNTFKLIKANQKSVEDYLQRLLTKGSNKFHLEDYEIACLSDLYAPITIDYNFTIPDYYRKIGDNIYISLVLDRTMTDALLENRSVPIENDYKYINRSIIKLKIPEGYQLKNLPDDLEGTNDNFGFKIQYDRTGSEVVVSREFYVDYLVMEPDSFESWNSTISEYAKACRKALILSKK